MSKTANEASTAELEIKRRGRRRLIGAITLGLLAIVFLPMLFDPAPKRQDKQGNSPEISVLVPPKDGQTPLPVPSATPPMPVLAPAVAPVMVPETTPEPVFAKEPPKEVPKDIPKAPPKEPVKVPAKVDKKDKPAAAEKKGFVVQLGVYADAENAKQIINRMKEAKLPVYTESMPIKTGTATRVRVGPYQTREKADAALAQVKLAGNDGKIVPLK